VRRFLLLFCSTAMLAGCGGGNDARGLARDEVLLQISATGRSENRPDEARFSVGVSTIAPSSSSATTLNNDKMNKVVAAVEKLGVKTDDIRTEQLTVNRIDWGKNKGRFEANNVVNVRVRKIDSASAAIEAATQAGANVLSGPNLTIGDPEKAKLSAYAAAYKAAKARADVYAEAAGLKVERALVIRDGGGPVQPMPYDMAQESSARTVAPVPTSGPPIRAGLTIDEVAVQVDFALTRK
jgi:uncharacterized protein